MNFSDFKSVFFSGVRGSGLRRISFFSEREKAWEMGAERAREEWEAREGGWRGKGT